MKTNSISAGLGVHARTIATTRQLIFRRAWLWTGFLAFATIAFGPQPARAAVAEAWVQRYGSEAGSGSADYAYKVVTDAAGNVIVAGSTDGGGLTIKYSGAGVPLWTNRCNGSASAVAVDASGNVFVTGSTDGGGLTIKYSSAGVPLWTNHCNGSASAVAADANGNVFVTGLCPTIKYSGAGVPLWTNLYIGSATALAVDASGNVFVTGWSGLCNIGCYGDYATIAYSGAGVPLWTNRYAGPGNDHNIAYAVAVDGSGNVFVTGFSAGSGGDRDYATIAYSGAGVPLWTNHYNGPANNSYDQATAVAVDASSNVFVTGYSDGDYATIAYSGAGVPLWTNRYTGPANGLDQPTAVAVDGSGNVFVTGFSAGSGGEYDYATIAYSGAGMPLWTNRYNGPGNGWDQALAVAVDGSGNVFVTGISLSSGGDDDYATIAYSGAGVPLWTNRYNGPANGNDQAAAVAVDASGNVFVTGSSDGSGGNNDYATIAYSGAGVALWTNRYSGGNGYSDVATAVAVDGSGNVFVTGYSGLSCPGPCTPSDYATIAYSDAGVPLWTNRYDGPANGGDRATAVAVDASGNVFVTGISYDGGGADYATIAYSGAGVPLWTNRYNGTANGDDQATAAAVDASGNVFVTGSSVGSGGSYDYATIVYSGAGVPLWTNRYNGPGNGADRPQTKSSLAIGSDGAVYVTGASDGLFLSDFATVKYVWRPEIAIQLLSTIPPKVNLTLSAAPNSAWAIERALALTGPWTNLSALLIGANGSAQFQDTNPPYPVGFYRARQQ